MKLVSTRSGLAGGTWTFKEALFMGQAPDGETPAVESLRARVASSSWSDGQTRDCIRDLWRHRGIAVDPHTAVGLLGLRRELRRHEPGAHGILLATAHPAKFAETVEPLTGCALPVPAGIARVMDRPRRSVTIARELGALRGVLACCEM